MQLNAPTKVVWWISVFLAVLGAIFYFVPAVKGIAFVAVLLGYILLFLGTIFKKF
jgi:hypothetical protein